MTVFYGQPKPIPVQTQPTDERNGEQRGTRFVVGGLLAPI